ncbi:MAG: histidinol-phosphate transaminase [Nitrospinae bacterium RIFCSPLOWO2_12_FULL_45_22]|nr:MAG: histidinol-phosphate transaminase [Nitrospinae bacterium RIFCSPLOWO2_12_FULL_45_22]
MGYLRAVIENMVGYVPGEQPSSKDIYIKLNTNENPYPPSPRVIQTLKDEINSSLRLYPDPLANPLRDKAAKVYGLQRENLLAGNGSDELLSIIVRAFIGKGDLVVYPTPTYTLYDTLIDIQEGIKETVEYPEDYSLPSEIGKKEARLTFLANPNSPSGTCIPVTEIEGLAAKLKGVLVVDEAYGDFGQASAIPLIKKYNNLIILRSFSKSFSLAGLRIGLAFADEEIINGLLKVKDSYNLNRLSIAAAIAALDDLGWMQQNIGRIVQTRKKVTLALTKLGFYVFPSESNFILARLPGQDLFSLYEWLKSQGILVRYFTQPRLQDCIRITIGTEAEMAQLIEKLEKMLPI